MAEGIRAVDMAFVKGQAVIRVLERNGVHGVVDLRVDRQDVGSVSSPSCQNGSGLVMGQRKSLGELFRIGWHNFSEDGNTLMVDVPDRCTVVYKFQEDGPVLRCSLEMPPGLHRCPVLSPNGRSVLATCVADSFAESDLRQAVVRVWPDLNFDSVDELPAVTLSGDRAKWVRGGEMLVVWEYDGERPLLNLFNTKDVASLDCQPAKSKQLNPGLINWKVYPHPKENSMCLVVCEFYKSGKRRVFEWHYARGFIHNELVIDTPQERVVEAAGFASGELPPEDSIECNLPVQSWKEYVRLAAEDARPPVCISDMVDGKVEPWSWLLGTFSWRHQWCALVSSITGATLFNCFLPEDIALSSRGMSNSVAIDGTGRHFVVIGERAIFAFSPTILRASQAYQLRTEAISDKAAWHQIAGNEAIDEAFSTLGSGPLARALGDCEASSFASGSRLGYDKLAFHQVGVCASGDWAAWLASGAFARPNEPLVAGITNFGNRVGRNRDASKTIPLPEGFRPVHVFVYPRGGEDGVAFLSESPAECVFFDHRTQETTRVPLDVEACLSVSQTRDLCEVAVLDKNKVRFLNLRSRSMEKSVDYKVDFVRLFKQLEWATDKIPGHRMPRFDDLRRISDQGDAVLLAWDAKTKKSIVVTPETEQERCEESIERAGDDLLGICQMNKNGRCTLFLDTDELRNGRIVVGLYTNKDRRVRNRICVVEGVEAAGTEGQLFKKLLDSIFVELTDDSSELIVLTVPNKDLDAHGIKLTREVKRFSIYGTEECIPDYDRLARRQRIGVRERIQKICDAFGARNVLNYPHSEGKTLFQEAFSKGDKDVMNCLQRIAQQQGIEIAVRWPSQDGKKLHNILLDGLADSDVVKVDRAIDFVASKECTLKDAAMLRGNQFGAALKAAPRRIEKALKDDDFIVELGKVEVHVDYSDPLKRRDEAVHINTIDDGMPWVLEDDPQVLKDMWRSQNLTKVEKMEKGGKATNTVSLKVISVEGAGVGGMGLIRHLLLHGSPESVFKSKAIMWIIEHKWSKFWKQKFKWEGIAHLVFLAILTAYIILIATAAELSKSDDDVKVSSSILISICFLYRLNTFVGEIRQAATSVEEGTRLYKSRWWGIKYYFSSKWNWVDLASCLLLLIVVPALHIGALLHADWDLALSLFVALEAILAYIKVWYYAQPFRVTGALVLMIENIAKDCIAFLFLAFVIMMGFALAFHVTLRGITSKDTEASSITNAVEESPKEKALDAFGSFGKSLLTVFLALFGDIDVEVYQSLDNLSWIIVATFSVYMVAQVIVLLNLLISIMADTFDRVKSNEKAQMLMARAMIIDSCEASASERELIDMELADGKYIYALEPIEEAIDPDSLEHWQGRLVRLEDGFRAIARKSEQNIQKTIGTAIRNMKNEINELIKSRLREDVQERTPPTVSPGDLSVMTRHLQNHLDIRLSMVTEETHRLTNQVEAILALVESLSQGQSMPSSSG